MRATSVVIGLTVCAGAASFSGCGQSAQHRDPDTTAGSRVRRPASTRGVITGTILDQVTGLPVEGVTVTASPPSATASITGTSNPSGEFKLDLPAGHISLTFSRAGYVSLSRDAGVGGAPLIIDVVLFPRGKDVAVGPAETTVEAGAASLVFPSGAYATPTLVSATWMEGTQVAAAPGDWLFLGEDDVAWDVTGVIHVEVASTPSKPVELRLPIPPGVAANTVALYPLSEADGTWGSKVAPTRIDGDFAVYSVSHFSDYAQCQPLSASSVWRVTMAKGDIKLADGTPLTVGMTLKPGDAILASSTGRAEILDPTGSTAYLSPSSQIVLGYTPPPSDTSPTIRETIMNSCYATLRVWAKKHLKQEHQLKVDYITIGVRGTVVSVGPSDCPGAASTAGGCSVEVTAGLVDVFGEGLSSSVSEGEVVSFCEGEPDVADPTPEDASSVDATVEDVAPPDATPEETTLFDVIDNIIDVPETPDAPDVVDDANDVGDTSDVEDASEVQETTRTCWDIFLCHGKCQNQACLNECWSNPKSTTSRDLAASFIDCVASACPVCVCATPPCDDQGRFDACSSCGQAAIGAGGGCSAEISACKADSGIQ